MEDWQPWQLLKEPLTKENFKELIAVHPDFYKKGIHFVSHNKSTIEAESSKNFQVRK
jgi:transglutaminase/protease-like cytokinesis protein 3